jgi:hypothetical protein
LAAIALARSGAIAASYFARAAQGRETVSPGRFAITVMIGAGLIVCDDGLLGLRSNAR